MILLKDIKNPQGALPAGTVNFYIIPYNQVLSIPAPNTDGVILSNIICKAGYRFYKWEFPEGNCELENPTSGDDASAYFSTKLEVLILKDDQANLTLFSKMLNGLFIILLDQRTKSVKLAGSLEVPLLLKSVRIKYGKDSSDVLGTTFTFESRVGPCLEYRGEIPLRAMTWRGVASSVYCLQDTYGNTGYKGWTQLEQYYTDNLALTGAVKANSSTDPNYVAPVYDNTSCPLPTYPTANLYLAVSKGTWEGGDLNGLSGYAEYFTNTTEQAHSGSRSGKRQLDTVNFGDLPVIPINPSDAFAARRIGRWKLEAWVMLPATSPLNTGKIRINALETLTDGSTGEVHVVRSIVSQTEYLITQESKGIWQKLEVIFDLLPNTINHSSNTPIYLLGGNLGVITDIYVDDISTIQLS